jgi:hypothetical protein
MASGYLWSCCTLITRVCKANKLKDSQDLPCQELQCVCADHPPSCNRQRERAATLGPPSFTFHSSSPSLNPPCGEIEDSLERRGRGGGGWVHIQRREVCDLLSTFFVMIFTSSRSNEHHNEQFCHLIRYNVISERIWRKLPQIQKMIAQQHLRYFTVFLKAHCASRQFQYK